MQSKYTIFNYWMYTHSTTTLPTIKLREESGSLRGWKRSYQTNNEDPTTYPTMQHHQRGVLKISISNTLDRNSTNMSKQNAKLMIRAAHKQIHVCQNRRPLTTGYSVNSHLSSRPHKGQQLPQGTYMWRHHPHTHTHTPTKGVRFYCQQLITIKE